MSYAGAARKQGLADMFLQLGQGVQRIGQGREDQRRYEAVSARQAALDAQAAEDRKYQISQRPLAEAFLQLRAREAGIVPAGMAGPAAPSSPGPLVSQWQAMNPPAVQDQGTLARAATEAMRAPQPAPGNLASTYLASHGGQSVKAAGPLLSAYQAATSPAASAPAAPARVDLGGGYQFDPSMTASARERNEAKAETEAERTRVYNAAVAAAKGWGAGESEAHSYATEQANGIQPYVYAPRTRAQQFGDLREETGIQTQAANERTRFGTNEGIRQYNATTGANGGGSPVRNEGEATTRLYETARDMALAGRTPQEIANFVARDDQPFKRYFPDRNQRFAIVNQAVQDAANARAKAAPNGTQGARERDMALAADRVRRLAGLDSPEANNLFLTNVQKVTDPGVAVMEADIKRLENTGTFGDFIGGWRNRAQGKGALTDNQKGRYMEAVDVMTGGNGQKPPAVDRARALASEGMSREEARAIMLREGYTF